MTERYLFVFHYIGHLLTDFHGEKTNNPSLMNILISIYSLVYHLKRCMMSNNYHIAISDITTRRMPLISISNQCLFSCCELVNSPHLCPAAHIHFNVKCLTPWVSAALVMQGWVNVRYMGCSPYVHHPPIRRHLSKAQNKVPVML